MSNSPEDDTASQATEGGKTRARQMPEKTDGGRSRRKYERQPKQSQMGRINKPNMQKAPR